MNMNDLPEWIRRDNGKKAGGVVFFVGVLAVYFGGLWGAGHWREEDRFVAALPALLLLSGMIACRWCHKKTNNSAWMVVAASLPILAGAYGLAVLYHLSFA